MRPFLLAGIGMLAAAALRGETLRFTSGPARVSLVELFTSEGCSSCPPAERWLGSLRDDPGLWREFVPIAFHVDYWNRLGWPDRFSTREFTAREYAYAESWRSGSVYTPCAVLNGVEWRTGGKPPRSESVIGSLVAAYDGARVSVEFSPAKEPAAHDYEVHAAILGAGIVSKVSLGENHGETLRHEFVALVQASARLGNDLALKVPATAGVPRHALAVWITRRGEVTPVQAVGGWLD